MLNEAKIKKIFQGAEAAPYRLKQIQAAFYRQGVIDFDQISSLPADLRARLAAAEMISLTITNIKRLQNAIKLVAKTRDGFFIEAVAIKMRDYYTACLSTQVGCSLQCVFCKSGSVPFKRNLTAEEIVDQFQLLFHISRLKPSHVVLMGMGEPMLNYAASVEALKILHDPEKWDIGQRQLTISTVGVKGKIFALAREPIKPRLAISLHAPNQKLREKLIPAAKQFPLPELLAEIRAYERASKHQITYEYIMLAGINDQPQHARELEQLLVPKDSMINLIPYNTVFPKFRASPPNQIQKFAAQLKRRFPRVTIRKSAGEKIAAACGQLAYQ